MHTFLYLSEIFKEKNTQNNNKQPWFSSLFIALFFVFSYHIFNIRIFLLTSGDSWYLPSGSEKNLTGSCVCVWMGFVNYGLHYRVILFVLIRSPSCHYLLSFLFSWPESPEKNLAIFSLEDICQPSRLQGKRAWSVSKFSLNPLVFNAFALSRE